MTSQKIIIILLFGAIGGTLRGLLGIAKALVLKKDFEINWLWFGITVAVSAILGMITASFLLDDVRMALVGGYAGTDFVEGLAKILLKNKFANMGKEKAIEEKGKKSQFGELIKKM